MLQDHSVAQGTGVNKRWLRMLDEYDVQFLALDLQSDRNLVEFLRLQPGWAIDLENGEAVLFARVGMA